MMYKKITESVLRELWAKAKIEDSRTRIAINEAMKALKKQIPKKPLEQRYVNLNEIENELIGHCPACKLRWDVAYWQRHCSNCGQKLDWSVEE